MAEALAASFSAFPEHVVEGRSVLVAQTRLGSDFRVFKMQCVEGMMLGGCSVAKRFWHWHNDAQPFLIIFVASQFRKAASNGVATSTAHCGTGELAGKRSAKHSFPNTRIHCNCTYACMLGGEVWLIALFYSFFWGVSRFKKVCA